MILIFAPTTIHRADYFLSTVVWVGHSDLPRSADPGAEKPDLVIKTLEEFVPEEWGLPPYRGD